MVKLTIVIPTHERHHILERVIDYYSSWDCQVVIADSSKVKYNKVISQNIIYKHYPGKSIGYKLYNAVLDIDSEFTCLSPDDDFLAKSGLLQGIGFLENNIDYASVSGNIINFKANKKNILIRPVTMPESRHGYHIESNVIFDRVMETFGKQHEYALHRTFLTIKCMKLVSNVEAITPFHFSFTLIAMCYGKHINLPIFWQARDLKRYNSYSVLNHEDFHVKEQKKIDISDPLNTVVINWPHYLSTLDGMRYRDCFIDNYQEPIKNKAERRRIFDMSIYNYNKNQEEKKKNIKQIIKKIIPSFIWGVYVAYRDSERMSSMMIKKFKNNEGYPWSDQEAKDDWNRMTIVIKKYNIS